ncbi:MAG: two-component sensor histidine kinase [Bradyrhizobium sp.]|uniref:ATP-binding protein n=1 Tax=Bradyrhizobium sp. TaxID=376 RepID=UPI001D1FBF80|nr:ATP-binding protein [Bradyrhizobium sp.]MBV9566157.1 two-component sensor histidine kinase [Bradyrhizobium sp.]
MSVAPRRKWRPSLAQIIFAVLAVVATLPLIGLFFFRLYDNQLIRQTQAELIAQSRVFAAIYAREVQAHLASNIPLGAELPAEALPDPQDRFEPIRPTLDLAADEMLRRRPDALPAAAPADKSYVEIGARLEPLIEDTQRVTLAGFRVLDPRGVVIAGRSEIGLSLAHVEEVASALRGEYRAVLRTRIPDKPPPPIYSFSRGLGVHVFSAMPVIVDNHIAGVVYTSRTPANIFQHFYQERVKFVLAGGMVVLATLAIGLVFSRTVTRPMYELIGRAERIRGGDTAAFAPLAHYGTREFAALSKGFLDMAEQLSRRSDTIATFSAHLTHELKSPLTSIKGAAELLLDQLEPQASPLTRMEQKSLLSNILSDVDRLEVMTRRLRELARAEIVEQHERAELNIVVGNLISRFPTRAIKASGFLDCSIGMSAEKALIVLSHLIDNAVRHNARTVQLEASGDASRVRITVGNDGDPISEPNRERIFDAFFTTRRDTGGTGMGLAIVRAVMTSHGGSIRLLPAEKGAAFELTFPAV